MPAPLLPTEHYPQEEEAGCLAACAQMVLAGLELSVSQAELNQLFELAPLGVPLARLKRLERYGVQVTIRRNGDPDELKQSLEQDIPSITFIRTGQLSYWQTDTQHAVVVRGYDGSDLLLNDPAFSEAPQPVNEDEFMLAWDEFNNAYAQITR